MGGRHKQIHEQGEHGALPDGCDCAIHWGQEARGDVHEQITGRPMHHADAETEPHIHKEDDCTAATGPPGCDGQFL